MTDSRAIDCSPRCRSPLLPSAADHILERQHDRHVVAAPCAGRELRERLPPSLARERGGRI
jgi:hypothetical protein